MVYRDIAFDFFFLPNVMYTFSPPLHVINPPNEKFMLGSATTVSDSWTHSLEDMLF